MKWLTCFYVLTFLLIKKLVCKHVTVRKKKGFLTFNLWVFEFLFVFFFVFFLSFFFFCLFFTFFLSSIFRSLIRPDAELVLLILWRTKKVIYVWCAVNCQLLVVAMVTWKLLLSSVLFESQRGVFITKLPDTNLNIFCCSFCGSASSRCSSRCTHVDIRLDIRRFIHTQVAICFFQLNFEMKVNNKI